MSRELERLLREARATLPLPRARATMEAREAVVGAMLRRRRRRLRTTAAIVTLGLATALGTGAGLLVAPSGGAYSPPVTGLGFLPAKGWTVVQSAPDFPERSAAVAANVPIEPADLPLEGPPLWTIAKLPPGGLILFATFAARGTLPTDFAFPETPLPLQLDRAYRQTSWNEQARPQDPVAQYRLVASNSGYNIDVRVYAGTLYPSERLLDAAQRQLDRLVVAGDAVTIAVRPAIVGWGDHLELFGAVAGANAGERVEIEAKECGQSRFRVVRTAATTSGGNWSSEGGHLAISATLRARSDDKTSGEVVVRQRPGMMLRQRSRTTWDVSVGGLKRFEGKRVVLERYDRNSARWLTVKTVTLAESGVAGVIVWTSARVRAAVPRGALVRAVFPRRQARPCYLAGYSPLVRAS